MPDNFDDILDRCIAEIAAGRETIDSCLRRYPAHAGQLTALLTLAGQARTMPSAASLPGDTRRMLESRLLRRADQLRARPMSRPAATRLPLWRRGLALVAASVIMVVLLLTSTVSVSASSVPGDALYPVKRAAEQVRLALASEQEQIDLHLEFARQRLQELRVLTNRGEVSEELLAEISNETALILEQAPALPQDKQQSVLASLTDLEDQHLKVLEVMASAAKGDARAKVMAALADTTAKYQQAKDLLTGATAGNDPVRGSPQGPRSTLVEEAEPPRGNSTAKPESTDKPGPQATHKVTKTPPGKAAQPTPQAPASKPTKESKPPKEPKSAKEPRS